MKKLLSIFAMLSTASLFAQEKTATRQTGYMQTLIMIAVFIVVFYFLLWRPDRKRRKELQQKRESLKKGDKVTAMGLIGTVEKVLDNTVVLKMYDGAQVEMLKAAITEVGAVAEEKKA